MQAKLHGMLPVSNGVFEPLQSSAIRWSNKLRQAAAVCNGLTMINKSTIAGDEVERSLFKAVEARFLVLVFISTELPYDVTLIECCKSENASDQLALPTTCPYMPAYLLYGLVLSSTCMDHVQTISGCPSPDAELVKPILQLAVGYRFLSPDGHWQSCLFLNHHSKLWMDGQMK